MVGKKVKTRTLSGTVELVYDDAIASGTNEYVTITMLLIKDEEGTCHDVKPRDIVEMD